jgi:membrane-associated phospholipid phosphatase
MGQDSPHRRWLWPLCAFLILLTAFSRMYLGVHTPLDVGVSLGTGILTVLFLLPVVQKAEGAGRGWGC